MYLTVHEVAELLRTPVSTVYQWSYRGDGPPARKVGRRLLFKRDEVIEWADAQVKEAAS